MEPIAVLNILIAIAWATCAGYSFATARKTAKLHKEAKERNAKALNIEGMSFADQMRLTHLTLDEIEYLNKGFDTAIKDAEHRCQHIDRMVQMHDLIVSGSETHNEQECDVHKRAEEDKQIIREQADKCRSIKQKLELLTAVS